MVQAVELANHGRRVVIHAIRLFFLARLVPLADKIIPIAQRWQRTTHRYLPFYEFLLQKGECWSTRPFPPIL